MTEKDEIIKTLKEYLKENLSIVSSTERGCYGMSDRVTVSVLLEGEEISKDTIDIN